MDWLGACIVPLYKGIGAKYEYSNSRGISLSVSVKLYGRVLIKRVRAGTVCAIGEEQYGFRQGRGCIDQAFAVRQVCERSEEHTSELQSLREISYAVFCLKKKNNVQT